MKSGKVKFVSFQVVGEGSHTTVYGLTKDGFILVYRGGVWNDITPGNTSGPGKKPVFTI